jgi:hypothetical protein
VSELVASEVRQLRSRGRKASSVFVQEFVSANNPLLTVDSGGHTLRDARLVDAGPTAGTNNGLDLTYNSAHLLDTQGKALVTYKIVIAGQPVPIKGWLFDKRRVG